MVRLAVAVAAAAAFGAFPPAAGAAPSRAPAITLLSQTPYVVGPGVLHIQVAVSGADPSGDGLEVLGFPQVITRTDFDAAARGHVRSFAGYAKTVPLSSLPAGTSGGFTLDVPVDEPAPPGSPLGTFTPGATGVYPFQLQVVDASGDKKGDPLTTFLVWASSAQNQPLTVVLVVPFASAAKFGPSGDPLPPARAAASRLAALASRLKADSTVPVGLLSDPSTLEAMQHGSASDRAALGDLADAGRSGVVEVLPATYRPVDVASLQQAGLGGDVPLQFAAGSQLLSQVYGAAPAQTTWVVEGPLDAATLASLTSERATQLVVPEADLTPLKAGYTQYTFAQPTTLSSGSSQVEVLAADAGITADFSAKEPPVQAANRLLAELAMIQTEQPANRRAVAALPPAGWQAPPEFVATLLAGLSGNPLLQAATPSSAFSAVPAKDGLGRQLAGTAAAPGAPAVPGIVGDAGLIQAARSQIAAIGATLPDSSASSVAALQLKVLSAESSRVTESERRAILASIGAAAKEATRQISLPAAGSVTLTATKGQLPITILSAPSLRARVELRLTSQKLIFQPFNPPGGSCQIPTPTGEICTLSLTAQNTTLKVPVQARSSGVFPLDVSIHSPGGAMLLGHDRDTVRSTAVSGVGVVLIVVAVLSLAVWWGRDLRHGRRADRLVPAPVDDADDSDTVVSDPVVDDFFSQPPPEYKPNGHSRAG